MERHPLYGLLRKAHHRGRVDDVFAVQVVDAVEVLRQADALGLGVSNSVGGMSVMGTRP